LPDTLGYRKRIGLVVPSTNTTVQPETDAIRLPGVTCHTGRVTIIERPLNTEQAFNEHMQMMRDGMGTAIDQIMTAGLDHLIMGYRPSCRSAPGSASPWGRPRWSRR
jgi:maleate isomerase